MSAPEMAVGQRTRRITIEACVDAMGPTRFPIEDWTPLVTLWAAHTVEGGIEQSVANQETGTSSDTWTIPYRSDCDPDLVDVVKLRRVRRNDRVYDVVSARALDMNQGLEFQTRAKVG
jgi:SPP1 family predicted phage head-tail adaptor